MEKIIVGSRESELALLQTSYVISQLQQLDSTKEYTIKKIKTKGDKFLQVSLSKLGDKGLFVKEIETALLEGEIDLAVHSMKDMPTELPAGLKIAAILEREDPRDVLLGNGYNRLVDLPIGALVGTSSLRRAAQLLKFRSDLKIYPVRGNLNTRLRKLKEENLAALVLAYAGVKRLGWLEKVTEVIPLDICLPAVGQGALGVEISESAENIAVLVSKLNHLATNTAVTAERAFLQNLEGGCQVPIGSLGEVTAKRLILRGVVATLDGAIVLRDKIEGSVAEPQELGQKLAGKLLAQGAADILEKAREEGGEHF